MINLPSFSISKSSIFAYTGDVLVDAVNAVDRHSVWRQLVHLDLHFFVLYSVSVSKIVIFFTFV